MSAGTTFNLSPPQAAKRGVYHRTGVDGSITFEVVDSKGAVQFELRPAEKHCNQRTCTWLQGLLDEIDPQRPMLTVERGGV